MPGHADGLGGVHVLLTVVDEEEVGGCGTQGGDGVLECGRFRFGRADAKRRIAAEVAALINDGETVLLDSGTTCLQIAHLLRGRQVAVMPLSLQAIHVLSDAPAPTTLLVPGGWPRAGEGALTGPLTLSSLAALRFDTAIVGC